MARLRQLLVVPVLLLSLTVLVSGCGSGGSDRPSPSTAYTAILDVRTPAEFAAGHISGARNLDVQSPTFASDVATLGRSGTYLVYCHSGNRAAQAAQIMKAAGLTVVSGGGLADMQADGFVLTS